jgi:dephospho-CoA kinase
MIASQLDLSMKIRDADQVIWNEGSVDCLEQQAALAAARLASGFFHSA